MSLITSVCSGGMTFHGLSFVHSICRPPSLLTSIKALTVAFPTINPRHRLLRRSPFDSAIRALASAAVSTASPVSQEGKVSAKAQWKAAIDFKWIRDNKDVIAANIMNRNSNANLNVVLDLYEKFLNLQKEVERLRAERNIVAEKMRGKIEASVRQALVQEGKNLKEKLASLEEDLVHLTDQLQQEAQCIPNITHPNVPIGGEESSVIRKTVGSPRELTFNIKDHLELGKELDLFDFDAAAERMLGFLAARRKCFPIYPCGRWKNSVRPGRSPPRIVNEANWVFHYICLLPLWSLFKFMLHIYILSQVSGSKFYYLKNEAVLLEMALINWAIAEVSKQGFKPLITPEIIRSSVVEKCGFQPRGQNTQVYSIENSDHCLIGTAEIPVGGMHMDSILLEADLPLKYVAYSHCFRTEAGAAGTASRGLYRVHQFSKVEMFIFCRPEDSNLYHEELIAIEEDLFSSLGLHFKTLDMATGDLGAPAYRKFDVEAWMPGLGRFGEISSASNCTDYQSRRLGIRFRPSDAPTILKKGKSGNQTPTQFVHTLNATACAIPRMIVCLLENFQQEDGSVVIPEPLRPYMGGLSVIPPKAKRI